MAAAARVLGNYELLGTILLQLSFWKPEDIIKCQRVCTTWNATIKTSKPRQRHLFFESVIERNLGESADNTSTKPFGQVNLLLAQCFGGMVFSHSYIEEDTGFAGGDINIVPEEPLPTGSWREMYATNPPCRSMDVYTETDADCHFHFRSQDGLRLGYIMDNFRSRLQRLGKALQESMEDYEWDYVNKNGLGVTVTFSGEAYVPCKFEKLCEDYTKKIS